jgi:hypothetical protein
MDSKFGDRETEALSVFPQNGESGKQLGCAGSGGREKMI